MHTAQLQADTDLQDAVRKELQWTPAVHDAHIGVAVTDGAVTLSGEVNSYPEKVQAAKAAFRVRGVTAVADEIEVRSDSVVNDADVARAATRALERAVDVPDNCVKVAVHHNVITLTGSVPWQFQRAAARRAVAYLKGVVDVVDEIKLRPTAPAAGTRRAITAALHRNAQVEADGIEVTDDPGGVVELTGTVHSWSARMQAEHAAWAAPGVTKVRNLLVVRG
ncbi:Osmotically-inducible protein OsmY, contains BON domain [Nakamurella panacisegetis]|uniref:Osmotically-inducible protein OsmY, contains BON domain n=1 Tax=Nakamurella panacisegetis TaxID=1090615 RepID=A0A1H0SB68_9ACTN|nr:BON domain-containing protein [Nakamurella panacisegetis]SDP38416.1 Osmotically-inducible protein OsmY, contains BON domain [Nakamurella panacisegetis]